MVRASRNERGCALVEDDCVALDGQLTATLEDDV